MYAHNIYIASIIMRTIFLTLIVEMEQNKMADAGSTDGTFYQTNMQPANWYTWFTKEGATDDDGWTQV